MKIKKHFVYLRWAEYISDQTKRRQRIIGISAVIVTQLVDVAITTYALTLPGIVELNPIGFRAMNIFGVIQGLLLVSIIAILMISVVTEFAANYCANSTFPPMYVRLLGYLPLTAVSIVAIAYNITLIITL
jgi:hypothetical protein